MTKIGGPCNNFALEENGIDDEKIVQMRDCETARVWIVGKENISLLDRLVPDAQESRNETTKLFEFMSNGL